MFPFYCACFIGACAFTWWCWYRNLKHRSWCFQGALAILCIVAFLLFAKLDARDVKLREQEAQLQRDEMVEQTDPDSYGSEYKKKLAQEEIARLGAYTWDSESANWETAKNIQNAVDIFQNIIISRTYVEAPDLPEDMQALTKLQDNPVEHLGDRYHVSGYQISCRIIEEEDLPADFLLDSSTYCIIWRECSFAEDRNHTDCILLKAMLRSDAEDFVKHFSSDDISCSQSGIFIGTTENNQFVFLDN